MTSKHSAHAPHGKGLQPSSMPDYLKWRVSPNGRYIAYVEDEPMVWTRSFDDVDSAITAMRWLVSERLILNGDGCGAVLDDDKGIIVSTDGLPVPTGTHMEEMVSFVRSKLQ